MKQRGESEATTEMQRKRCEGGTVAVSGAVGECGECEGWER